MSFKLFSASPERDDWAVIHMMQQMLLLPLIANYTTNQIQEMVVDGGYPALSIYDFLEGKLKYNEISNALTYEQSNSYFYKMNWESGSTIINNLPLVLILILIGIVNLIVLILYCST